MSINFIFNFGNLFFQKFTERLFASSSIIDSKFSIPEKLKKIIEEARNCYAFGQYRAFISLCRTILEVAMRDIYFIKEEKTPPMNSKEYYEECLPKKLINYVSKNGKIKKSEISDLYYEDLSPFAHGTDFQSKEDVTSLFTKTIKLVKEIYEAN